MFECLRFLTNLTQLTILEISKGPFNSQSNEPFPLTKLKTLSFRTSMFDIGNFFQVFLLYLFFPPICTGICSFFSEMYWRSFYLQYISLKTEHIPAIWRKKR